MSPHMHLSLWLPKVKKLPGVLLMCLKEEKGRGNCLSQQSTSATLFANFHHEIAFTKSSSQEEGQDRVCIAGNGGGEDTSRAWLTWRGKYKAMLNFWKNQALSPLRVSFSGYKDVSWNISLLWNHTRVENICQPPRAAVALAERQ